MTRTALATGYASHLKTGGRNSASRVTVEANILIFNLMQLKPREGVESSKDSQYVTGRTRSRAQASCYSGTCYFCSRETKLSRVGICLHMNGTSQ